MGECVCGESRQAPSFLAWFTKCYSHDHYALLPRLVETDVPPALHIRVSQHRIRDAGPFDDCPPQAARRRVRLESSHNRSFVLVAPSWYSLRLEGQLCCSSSRAD